MKLHNQALKYLSVSIFVIVSIWAAVLYVNLLDEVHDSIDDSLEREKAVIVQKMKKDPATGRSPDFGTSPAAGAPFAESNFVIRETTEHAAVGTSDHYTDTVMYLPGEDDGEPFRMLTTAFRHEGKYYELKVISSTVEEDDLIEDLFWSIVWLYVILLVSIVAINNFVLKKLWKPFYSLLQQLQQFRVDRNDPLPAIQTKTREFRELKAASDALITRTIAAFASQKQFTENAAHELQTPLAIITNKLELLLERGTLEETDAETVAQTLQTATRLSQINKALLLLSKIENKQFADDQPVQLNKIVRQTVSDLEEFSGFKQVTVTITGTDELNIKADTTLAHILVSNLIRNAVFHNRPQGTARIHITGQSLTISNTAENGELPSGEIFKRFYKSSPVSQSTGLGLAIVHAICKLYGFTISYAFSRQEHHFTVRFA